MRKKVIQQYKSMLDQLQDLSGTKAAKKEREIIKYMRDSVKGSKAAIRAAYEANKDRIDEHTPGMSNRARWQGFYDNVAATMIQKNLSTKDAIKKQLNSANYQSKANVMKNNVLQAIRSDPDAYDKWRRWTEHKKIDLDKLNYVGNNTYTYEIVKKTFTRTIEINFEDSPKQIIMGRQDKGNSGVLV